MNLSTSKSLLLLHFVIIIWGFTGILGKLINLNSDVIVWNRMTISFISLFLFQIILNKFEKISVFNLIKYSIIGILIAIHWICFFEAIKLSTVSLALICLSSVSLFTAILDPIIKKKKILTYEILLSLLVIIGIGIVFKSETLYYNAIILSILSAFFAALFTIFNHKLINSGHKAINITIWEMFGGSLGMTIYLVIRNNFDKSIIPLETDLIYILILALICTAFAFYASVEVMKKISPFTTNLSVNLEPIYAIILAIIFFGEDEKMSNGFYIGASIILSSIIINNVIKQIKN